MLSLLDGNRSTDEFSVEMSAMAASADPVPMAASADPVPAERGVRLINKRGYQYPAEHVTSAEAEGYGAISTSRSLTAEEIVPVDSDTDTLAHVDSESMVLATGEPRADIGLAKTNPRSLGLTNSGWVGGSWRPENDGPSGLRQMARIAT
jgi:hypothetical protein